MCLSVHISCGVLEDEAGAGAGDNGRDQVHNHCWSSSSKGPLDLVLLDWHMIGRVAQVYNMLLPIPAVCFILSGRGEEGREGRCSSYLSYDFNHAVGEFDYGAFPWLLSASYLTQAVGIVPQCDINKQK